MQNLRDKSGYLSESTITAIATAVGGALTVIRISGSRAFEALGQLTRNEKVLFSEPRKLIRASLFSNRGDLLDDALFARFPNPNSYTGEDVVELHIHGSSFIAQRVIETLGYHGIRQALPGEFSFRAVKNGKMSLVQAQAVADLIAASNDGAVSLALEKLSGSQNRYLSDLASGLRHLAVLGEVGIDFADQDIDEVALKNLQKQLDPLITTLTHLKESYDRGSRLQEGVKVAFVGLPNAGKSSFFNALLGEDRSIVSDIAGTTRDIVREKLTLRGSSSTITLRLEDTAGLRITDHPIEQIGIERTRQSSRNSDLILFIVDPNTSMEEIAAQWNSLQTESGSSLINKTIGIITKVDLISPEFLQNASKRLVSLGIQNWIPTSAQTGSGISNAIDQMIQFCEKWTHRRPGEILLTRTDHLNSVNEALNHLSRAQNAPEIDLFASDIRQSLHSLGPLIGETVPDDILGKIFSDFCIGK